MTAAGRRRVLLIAAADVCASCGKRALPNEPESHVVHGPNSAGNFTHFYYGKHHLCGATSIHSRLRYEAQGKLGSQTEPRRDEATDDDVLAPGVGTLTNACPAPSEPCRTCLGGGTIPDRGWSCAGGCGDTSPCPDCQGRWLDLGDGVKRDSRSGGVTQGKSDTEPTRASRSGPVADGCHAPASPAFSFDDVMYSKECGCVLFRPGSPLPDILRYCDQHVPKETPCAPPP